jgi:protein-L-isoaspartate(D-aspartate) O-methyltransferase
VRIDRGDSDTVQPLLFTVEFRKKMAQLSQRDREEWLASLAARLRRDPSPLLRQELREVARGCRLPLVDAIQKNLGPFDPLHLMAILEVPREQFVRTEDVERSAEDVPLPLDDEGLATISAPHAYLLSFRLLELAPGDSLVELGTGSGYGAALAAFIVGPEGRVATFEIDERLFHWADRTLSEEPCVSGYHADAVGSAPRWGDARKVVVTFAVETLPDAWVAALPEGGRLVAPVGGRDRDQRLVLVQREDGRVVETDHGAVRYVKNRSTR